MPGRPQPDTRPWRPPRPPNLDLVPGPSAADGLDSCSDAPCSVPAASTPSSTAPTDAPPRTSQRAKFVWRRSAQVPPLESSPTNQSSPVSINLKNSYQPPAPAPLLDPSASSIASVDTRATSSPSPPRSKSPHQFIYRPPPPASPDSSNPLRAQSAPSASTSAKTAASQSRFVYRATAPPTAVAPILTASSSTVSNLEVRKVRSRCSKCGSKSHLWKDCPSNRKCARCAYPENKQLCATVVIRTRMMKDCRDNGDLPQMWNLLRSLKSDGHKPTVHSYSLLLSLLVSRGQMQEAQNVWKAMTEDGVVADTICYNTLLNGWCSAGKLEEAKAILKEMKERQFQLTTSTYNTLIKGFGLAGQAAEAVKLLQQMTSEGAKPNKQTYNILINAWAQVKDVEQARRFLQLMRNAGLSSDVVTYNTIAKAYAELRRSFEAERVINEMQDAYIRPNERTYGIVINSYCETGRPEEGFALLDRMRMDGVRCNLAVYNILIKGFAELYQPENVDKVLETMEASGVKPDVQSFSLVMNVWCSSGLAEEGRAIFERMQKVYGVRPDVTAYTILAKGYVRARRPAEAEGLISEMTSRGLKPNVFTYTTVISGWCNVGSMEDAYRIFKDMQTSGVSPNSNTVNTLIWGFSESKQPQRAEEVLELIKTTGFKADRKCLELVAEAWRSVGLPGEGRRFLEGEGSADAISDENSLRRRFDSMITRREIDLDSKIHKELTIEPESLKTRSSATPTQIAINSIITGRVTCVAAKSWQQTSSRGFLRDPRRRTQAFEVRGMLFVRRTARFNCTDPASRVPLFESRVNCRTERVKWGSRPIGSFLAGNSLTPAIIL